LSHSRKRRLQRLQAQELKEAQTEKLPKGVFNEVKHMVLVQKVWNQNKLRDADPLS
jgi:hypothetical protein